MFIASRYQFFELMRLFLGEAGIAHFIDHQQARRDVATQLLPHQAGMRRTFSGACQISERRKHH